MPLNDFDMSVRMHEAIYKIAATAVYDAYPRPRYATVTAVNVNTNKITMQYPDDATAFTLIGTGLLPVVGSVVRVAGLDGARYVDEILDVPVQLAATSDTSSAALTIPPSSHATSERASITLGDWSVGQDSAANGTKNFYIWNPGGGFAFVVSTAGGISLVSSLAVPTSMTIGTTLSVGSLISVTNGGEYMRSTVSAGFQTWYTGGTRIGYLQGNAGTGLILNSEVSTLRLIGGAVSLEGPLSINAVTISLSNANPTFSASSYSQFPGGLYVSGGTLYVAGPLQARGGVSNDSGSGTPGVRINGAGSLGIWSAEQLQVMETTATQSSAMALYTGPTAPILRAYGPFGDRLDCLNNPNTAYCPIHASAFNVTSSERIKHDITTVEDDELLTTLAGVKTHKFVANARPMTIPLSDKFMDINRRWTAKGKRPLTPTGNHYEGEAEPHDCDDPRHNCFGAPDHPCPITKNETPRFGIIAEHLHDHVPEAVFYGEDEKPAGYDVDQVAAMAFGGVGALLRKIEELTDRVKVLEAAPAN